MGFQFRKSFSPIKGVRINLSKNGISTSVGVSGARVSLNSKGKITSTLSVPGTGLYYTTNHSKKQRQTKNTELQKEDNMTEEINRLKQNDPELFDFVEDYCQILKNFNLNENELGLFVFILKQQEMGELQEEFEPRDVSMLGWTSSTTYYSKLYNKGLLDKPKRGVYSVNTDLLTKLEEEYATKQREEAELARLQAEKLEQEAEERKQKAAERAKKWGPVKEIALKLAKKALEYTLVIVIFFIIMYFFIV